MSLTTTGFYKVQYDTADLPVDEQFSFWRDGVGKWVDAKRECDDADPFYAKLIHYQTKGFSLNKYDRLSQASTRRTSTHIADDNVDIVGIDFRLNGRERGCEFKNNSTLAKPGDIRVYDVAQPFFTDNDEYVALSLWVERRLINESIQPAASLHGRLLKDGPVQQVFKAHLHAAFEAYSKASAREAEHLSNITVSLVNELLAMEMIESLESDSIRDQTIRHAIYACIRKHMAESSLGPDIISKEIGVSRAKLYRLCKAMGTPMDIVRRVRLYAAAQRFKKSPNSNIADVGYSLGFASRQVFTRAFKAEFGVTPSEFALNQINLDITQIVDNPWHIISQSMTGVPVFDYPSSHSTTVSHQ